MLFELPFVKPELDEGIKCENEAYSLRTMT